MTRQGEACNPIANGRMEKPVRVATYLTLCRHIRGVPRAQMRYSPFATAQFNERSSPIATAPQSSVATANAIRRRLVRVGLRLKCMSTTYAHLSQLSMRRRAHRLAHGDDGQD